ncbi:acyl-CoA desaturase [Thermoleophilia bacterium SCSIO 60948]|nr:acyl-CoA desaturase [Thermoleophilia bacterium SCSIO 60948]
MPTVTDEPQSPLKHLSKEQIDALGEELDALHDEIYAELGDRDRKYITSMIELHRRLLVMARAELVFSPFKPAWILGTATLGAAKILENMEIGHNVLHGQWDWMNDPYIHSSTWDWDTASTAESWKHSHNYVHHTYTNIRGKDKDLGYEIMRIDPHQPWHPVYLLQPIYNVLLMLFFEWGVAVHDMDIEAIRAGEKSHKEALKDLKGISGKMRDQIVKDYIAWPLISALPAVGLDLARSGWGLERRGGNRAQRAARKVAQRLGRKRKPSQVAADVIASAVESGAETFWATVKANVVGNLIRNIWSNWIIFCGHFPDQTYTFSQKEVEDESRGAWYVRQMVGAANIEGSPFFHVASGNLSYQVEHHLFPDMPSTRYAEIAPRVKDICARYELPYNTGPFLQQWGMVQRTILRLAFPGGKVRPKPDAYKPPKGGISQNGHNGSSNGRVKASVNGSHKGENGSGPEQESEGVRFDMPSDD